MQTSYMLRSLVAEGHGGLALEAVGPVKVGVAQHGQGEGVEEGDEVDCPELQHFHLKY